MASLRAPQQDVGNALVGGSRGQYDNSQSSPRFRPIADSRRGGDEFLGISYTGGTTGRPKGVKLTHAVRFIHQPGGPRRSPSIGTPRTSSMSERLWLIDGLLAD
ncbi:AMP-binding protein [Micromonospora sp. NPDC048930]|uniref:AMP-binding protein n=1 Tax=Micromonospora sp. NPDC048930 TaxID=3364261 RepID=UPI00371624D5